MRFFLTISALICICVSASGQDTFHVKKNTKVTTAQSPAATWNPENTDSIVSYTVEFQKPGTNIWIVLHEKGPRLGVPVAAYGANGASRVYFKEIIAVDQNGIKYRQPDRLWKGGVLVTLDQKE